MLQQVALATIGTHGNGLIKKKTRGGKKKKKDSKGTCSKGTCYALAYQIPVHATKMLGKTLSKRKQTAEKRMLPTVAQLFTALQKGGPTCSTEESSGVHTRCTSMASLTQIPL